MSIVLYVVIFILVAGLGICFGSLISIRFDVERYSKVFKFRREILDMASMSSKQRLMDQRSDWNDVWEIYESMPSCDKMIHSPRPLTLEAWFTPEQCAALHEGDNLSEEEYETYVKAVLEREKELKEKIAYLNKLIAEG